MGVFSTNCSLCGLPVQHDHYVASEPLFPGMPAMLKIYRGDESPDCWVEGESPFQFGPEHQWLRQAVAVLDQGLQRGFVHDGVLTPAAGGEPVWLDESDAVLHEACWELSGANAADRQRQGTMGTHQRALVAPFSGQLFEFHDFREAGKGWALVDPRLQTSEGERSRARIEALKAEMAVAGDPTYRTWTARPLRNERLRGLVRYRETSREWNLAAFPHLTGLAFRYEPAANGLPVPALFDELERFEVAMVQAVEHDGQGLLLRVLIADGKASYVLHSRKEDIVERIDALPFAAILSEVECEQKLDPEWAQWFESLDPNAPPPELPQPEPSGPVVERAFVVKQRLGLHAMASMQFCVEAQTFSSTIVLVSDGRTVNAKDLSSMMLLSLGAGAEVTIRAMGDDAERAVEALGARLG